MTVKQLRADIYDEVGEACTICSRTESGVYIEINTSRADIIDTMNRVFDLVPLGIQIVCHITLPPILGKDGDEAVLWTYYYNQWCETRLTYHNHFWHDDATLFPECSQSISNFKPEYLPFEDDVRYSFPKEMICP
jgi:hypothetical protein